MQNITSPLLGFSYAYAHYSTHRLPEPKEGTEEGKREGDTKPEAKEGKQGGKGNGTRGPRTPVHEV